MAEMTRRTTLLALAILGGMLVVAPLAYLSIARPATPGASAPGASAPGEPAAEARPIGPADVAWVYAPWIFARGPRGVYELQAGTLADPAPVIDLEVPWVVDQQAQVGREPAVGPVIDGTVVFVADDGQRSRVRRAEVAANGADEVMADLRHIVWSMAVAPSGTHAYLGLVDRNDDRRDLGVVRLALDGSGDLREVMPTTVALRPDRPGVRLAAVAGFDVDLRISSDGRHLVRRVCDGGAACTIDVLDVESGGEVDVGGREVLGAAGGILLTSRCAEVRCFSEIIDLATGRVEELRGIPGEVTITLVGDRAAIVFVEQAADGRTRLRALDPITGEARDLLEVPAGGAIGLAGVQGDLRVSLPHDHLLVSVATDVEGVGGGAVVPFQDVAVPPTGGAAVELPSVPLRHPDGFLIQG